MPERRFTESARVEKTQEAPFDFEPLYQSLGVQESPTDKDRIRRASLVLKRELGNIPNVGRTIGQNQGGRNEFVIPIFSREQKRAILYNLGILRIIPWEENGLLIIDYRRDLERIELAGLVTDKTPAQKVDAPEEVTGSVKEGPKDTEERIGDEVGAKIIAEDESPEREDVVKKEPYVEPKISTEVAELGKGQGDVSVTDTDHLKNQFPSAFQATKKVSKKKRGERKRPHDSKEEKSDDDQEEQESEDFESGIDTELLDIVRRFDMGEIDSEDEEFTSVVGHMPTLTLFPHKYIWNNRILTHARTGEVYTDEKQLEILRKAIGGDENARTEYIRMHVGFVIYLTRRMQDLFKGAGDIDELFQEGLIGLNTAISRFKEDKGASLTHYAAYWIEQRIRRHIQNQRQDVRVPIHLYKKRRKVSGLQRVEEKKRRLMGGEYDTAENLAYLGNLNRLARKLYIGTEFDPIEDYTDEALPDTEFFAHRLTSEGLGEKVIDHNNLKSILDAALMSLTPRQERVLRLRFGLTDMRQVTIPGLAPGERETSQDGPFYSDGLTLEEVGKTMEVTRERVRQIEAKALRILRARARRNKSLWRFVELAVDPRGVSGQEESAHLSATLKARKQSEKPPVQRVVIPSFEEELLVKEWLTLTQLAEGFGLEREEVEERLKKLKEDPDNSKLFKSRGDVTKNGITLTLLYHKDLIKLLTEILKEEEGEKPPVKPFADNPFVAENPFIEAGDEVDENEDKEWKPIEDLEEEFGLNTVDILLLALNYRSTNPEWFDGFKGNYLHPNLVKVLREKIEESRKETEE